MTRAPDDGLTTALDRAVAALGTDEYASRLHLRPAAIAGDRASVVMPFAPSILNRGGRVHGGAIASALLTAARMAAAASEKKASEREVHVLAANVAFLSVPRHGDLVSSAHVTRRGREVAHLAVEALDDAGGCVAHASVTVGFADPDVGAAQSRQGGHRVDTDLSAARPVDRSPYLSAAGVLILPAAGRKARAFLPLVRNRASQPSRMDEGAVAGLADSCAAYAAHLCETHVGERGGVTVSMGLAFHAAGAEDLIGTGMVTSRIAGSYIAVVEVVGATSGVSVANGFAVYRLTG